VPICIVPECRKNALYLKYGRCEECWQKWDHRDNPEPDAKKKRATPFCKGKGDVRGHFIVANDSGHYSSKKKELVPEDEATVFAWKRSAQKLADEIGGAVIVLGPVSKKEVLQ